MMNPYLLTALVLLALLQIWLLVRSPTITAGRKAIRAGLNALLWLTLLGFVWQPVWTRPVKTTHALLVGDGVPTAVARRVQDSLQLSERVTGATIQPEELDSVTLLGQPFPPALLARLSRQTLRWIPFSKADIPIDVHWKGIVRVGEEQLIRGAIQTTERKKLSVRFGNQPLDSLWLKPGRQAFTLRFTAPARGRTETVLWLDDEPVDTIRFFGQATRPLTVRFVLNTPDFETKNLADWLGRQGNRVELTSNLSTGIDASLRINAPARQTNTSVTPDLVVTEPSQVGQAIVRKALAERKSVLVLNLANPESEIPLLNRALGTNWRTRKVSNEPTVPAGNGLTALPYRFAPALNQRDVRAYPVAVQTVGGRVGVSLFSETFPLKLSGDSLAYARLWNAVLAQLQPVQDNNLMAEAPIATASRQAFRLNNSLRTNQRLTIAKDTASLVVEPLNPRTLTTRYRLAQTGWQPLADSAEVYVETGRAGDLQQLSAWLSAHNRYQDGRVAVKPVRDVRVPDWVWLTLILVCLTALWVEPKL